MLSHAAATASAGPWPEMWARAATGPDGFWRRHRVGTQFRTATTGSGTGSVMAAAVCGLLAAHPTIRRVIDLGAGDGGLIGAVAARRPDLDCVGIDLRPGPDLAGVGWLVDEWDPGTAVFRAGLLPRLLSGAAAAPTLVIMNEWLDELPVSVLARAPDGAIQVGVDRNGRERAVGPATATETAWAGLWWPGPRVEVGVSRDIAWAAVVERLGAGGLALMIDYGHRRDTRPVGGSLRGYAAGRLVDPVPDGTCNLTCDVAVDAVRAAGERAGATTLVDADQTTVLGRLEVGRPDGDPIGMLAARSAGAALTSPNGFGGYRWLLQVVR